MNKPTLYVVSQPYYAKPYKDIFDVVEYPDFADVVLFSGGEDVSPSYYGEPAGKYTFCDKLRDVYESQIFHYVLQRKKPMLGICRGAQFLTVMSGGKLVQDITGHARSRDHKIFCQHHQDGKPETYISSTHHQMMYPFDMPCGDYQIEAYTEHRSSHYLNGWNDPIPHCGIEPEIVFYPKTKSLCIQGHPEIMPFESDGVMYCKHLIKRFLLGENHV